MASFVTPQNGESATAESVAQLTEDFSGLRNIPVSLTGINDASSYGLIIRNAGSGARGLLIYAADGSTVLLQVDGSGVLASRAGAAAERVLTTGESGTVTAAMIANRTRSRWFSAAEFQISSGTPTFSTGTVSAPYWLMADAAQSAVATSLAVPNDWASGALTFNLYFSPLASGSVGSREVNITLTTTNTTPGTVVSGGSTTDDISTSATSDGLTVTAHSRTVTPAAAGDLVGIVVQRNGAAGTDDLASQVRFYGVRVDYLADS